jgi:GNAT superfamily N-acetyltransferase
MKIEIGAFDDVVQLECEIPEFDYAHDRKALQDRMSTNSLILVARVAGAPAGFKAAYEVSPKVFYAWIGGVLPEYRRQGVAKALLDAQEAWAIEQGYERIRVKSMNRFMPMVRLLLKNDYLIVGYEDRGDKWSSKIWFEKELKA